MINKKGQKDVCSEERLLATDSQFNARKSGALRSSLSKSGATKRGLLKATSLSSRHARKRDVYARGVYNFGLSRPSRVSRLMGAAD